MYRQIYVPVDNSEHANAAVDLAIALARSCGAEVIGCHVYAARLHDIRFKQMEFTLPEEYRQEQELERQRSIHDSLITMGLRLISDSYLDTVARRCEAAGVPFRRKSFDGRNYQVLARDIQENAYDLVVMGALGMGAVRESLLGSVTERVVRRVRRSDVLVVKHTTPPEKTPGSILVALDGSPQSFAGLRAALDLGKTFQRPVKAVAVYDPYLHYTLFHGIAGVLSEQASRVFKFKEQEQLHEEIIDTGLAKIYQSHLEVARKLAQAEGIGLEVVLLAGKVFEKILHLVRKDPPWLLVLGRIGIHSEEDMDIGSNTENLLRLAPCNVWITSRQFVPPLDLRAEESVSWTEEALERMEKVPAFVRGVARSAVQRWAMERGHSVITSSIIDQAVGDLLPASAVRAMGLAAQAAQAAPEADGTTYVCILCGYTSRDHKPARCPVCGSDPEMFRGIDRQAVIQAAAREGGVQEETAFDGVKLRWSREAREMLRTVPSGYMRRRTKARVEKSARVRGLDTITRDLVAEIVSLESEERRALAEAKSGTQGKNEATLQAAAQAEARVEAGLKGLTWTGEALARLERVPAGFMRQLTRQRIEDHARERGITTITLEVAEAGIAHSRRLMEEMIRDYTRNPESAKLVRSSLGPPEAQETP